MKQKAEPVIQRLLSIEAAAAYLGMSFQTVRRMAKRGELTAIKIGRLVRYNLDELEALRKVS